MKLMMSKVKANAKWNGLTNGQRARLEEWLFEERLGYRTVWERAVKELEFKGSVSSVRRFYERTSRERVLKGFSELAEVAKSVNAAPGEVKELRLAALKVMGQLLLKGVVDSPERPGDWLPLMRMLLRSEEVESRNLLRREQMDLRRQEFRQLRVRYEYNVVEEARKHLPDLNHQEHLRKTAGTNNYLWNKLKNDARRVFFGKEIDDPLPESPEEELAQADEVALREARAKLPPNWKGKL
jgi:hypothetical protein